MIYANRACGILYRFIRQNGGHYLLPANVCPVVPLTFRLAEVDFEFVDIDSQTLCIDEQRCLSLAEYEKCNGLVFVHTYGTSYNPQSFFRQLRAYMPTFHIVDDRCLCAPNFFIPKTVADLTLFSTGYAKFVDLGGGGFGFLQEGMGVSMEPLKYDGFDIEEVYKEAFTKKEKLANVPSGWLDAYVVDHCYNEYRRCVEQETGKMKEHKQEINALYRERLGLVVSLPEDFNQWRYNILVENKQYLLKKLFDSGLFASSHYQPSSELFVDEFFPNAQRLYERVINLFNDKYITREKAIEITKLIC